MLDLYDIEYLEQINPINLFDSSLEVIEFLKVPSTLEDLNAFLKLCLDEELYSYCSLIQNKINEINLQSK